MGACGQCVGTLRIVVSTEEPSAIRAILADFEKRGAREKAHYRPARRAPPDVGIRRKIATSGVAKYPSARPNALQSPSAVCFFFEGTHARHAIDSQRY